ncbi:MAG: FoF1 ATP synthase subunit a [Candidatus Paceibacterota bacterium]
MDFLQLQREQVSIEPHTFMELAGVPITNTLITGILVMLLLAVFGIWGRSAFSLIPGKVQNAFEMLYEGMLSLIQQVAVDRTLAERAFPLVAALFVYIGLANLITLVPGLGSITLSGESLLRTPTSDINLPLALAAGSVLLVNIEAVKVAGFFSYVGRYFKFKELIAGFRNGVQAGFVALVEFFVGLLDILFEFTKVISLSFRLFGNMFAGELLAVLILGAVAYAVPALWMSLNLLFGIVHALVFGALATAYYALAVRPEEDVTAPTSGMEEVS